jgi:hypothetical protein
MNQQTQSSERRQSKRSKSLKGGQIVYQSGNCVMDCLILDLSNSGAKIRPADPIKCPLIFTLRFADEARRCVVVRQSGSEVGVHFVDAKTSTPPGTKL